MKKLKFLLILLFISAFIFAASCSVPYADGNLNAYVLDVGNADSSVIIAPSGEVVMIDTGEASSYKEIRSFLRTNNISVIDALILTHAHADHIGGTSQLLDDFTVRVIYMTDAAGTSQLYENMLEKIHAANIPVKKAESGTSFKFGDIVADCIAPVTTYSDLNNSSIVTLIRYGSTSFLFTGDIESRAEWDILDKYGSQINVDFLKVAHHGSNSSSNNQFIQEASPQYTVISCSSDNPYGHPADITIDKLKTYGAKIYRTDQNGTVRAVSNGEVVSVTSEK